LKSFYLLLVFLLPLFVFSQTCSVTGRIISANKEPLPGSKILLAGTTNGAIADTNGNFELKNISAGKIQIIISYIGYKSDTLGKNVSANTNLKLDEIV